MSSKKQQPGSGTEIAETLQQIRQEYWQSLDSPLQQSAGETESYLVFRLGKEAFAVPARMAREVVRIPHIVAVPLVREPIRGIINLRGEIVAVSDLRHFFGLPAAELQPTGRLVVVAAAGLTTALYVETVEGIRRLDTKALAPATPGLGGVPREALAGQVRSDQGLLVVLNLDYILSRPEFTVDFGGE